MSVEIYLSLNDGQPNAALQRFFKTDSDYYLQEYVRERLATGALAFEHIEAIEHVALFAAYPSVFAKAKENAYKHRAVLQRISDIPVTRRWRTFAA